MKVAVKVGVPRFDFTLRFSPKWRGGSVSILQDDGTWREMGKASESFVLPEDVLLPLMPQFFKVSL